MHLILAIAPEYLHIHISRLHHEQWLQKWQSQPSELRTFKHDVKNCV